MNAYQVLPTSLTLLMSVSECGEKLKMATQEEFPNYTPHLSHPEEMNAYFKFIKTGYVVLDALMALALMQWVEDINHHRLGANLAEAMFNLEVVDSVILDYEQGRVTAPECANRMLIHIDFWRGNWKMPELFHGLRDLV